MNPFNYISIAQGDSFYDRKEETERIVKTLSGGNNMVLFAPRRYGKTSLVFRVMDELERQGFVCVYFDLMPVYSLEAFVEMYLKALYRKQTVKDKFATVVSGLRNLRPKLTFDSMGTPELSVDVVEPKVSVDIVDECVDRILEMKHDYYFELFDKFSAAQKRLLVAIAKSGENVFSSRYIAENRLVGASSIQKSVAVLTEAGVIEKADAVYSIGDPFFRRYILRNVA